MEMKDETTVIIFEHFFFAGMMILGEQDFSNENENEKKNFVIYKWTNEMYVSTMAKKGIFIQWQEVSFFLFGAQIVNFAIYSMTLCAVLWISLHLSSFIPLLWHAWRTLYDAKSVSLGIIMSLNCNRGMSKWETRDNATSKLIWPHWFLALRS